MSSYSGNALNNSSSQANTSQNSSSKVNKNSQSAFEKMKQQLELRKQFLIKMEEKDEKEILTGNNIQEKAKIQQSVASNLIKKQLQLRNQHQSKFPFKTSEQNPIIIQSPKDKNQMETQESINKDLNNIENDDDDVQYDQYYSVYTLQQEYLLPDITSGESSPAVSDDENVSKGESIQKVGKLFNQKIPQSTSLDDILDYLIDSDLLQIDKEPQAQRATKNDRSSIWQNCYELLFCNINVTMSLANLKKEMKERFRTFIHVNFKDFRTLYYQGKYSLLVTFGEKNNAQFVYFNYTKNQQQYRQILGDHIEVYKVNANYIDFQETSNTLPSNVRQRSSNSASSSTSKQGWWIPVVLRNIPIHIGKSQINSLLQTINVSQNVLSIEEPIILNEKKHTLIIFSDLDSAVYAIQQIPIKLKDFPFIKANLHPKYTKQSWKKKNYQENKYYIFYKSNDKQLYLNNPTQNATPGPSTQYETVQSYINSSKTCQFLQFKKSFLEDVIQMNKIFKNKKNSDKEDDYKKLSQRSTTPIYHHEKNNDIENHEMFISQKSSMRNENESPSDKEENAYLDNPPLTDSFLRQMREEKYSQQKSKTYSSQDLALSQLNKDQSEKSPKTIKEDKRDTKTKNHYEQNRHSTSKDKSHKQQKKYDSPYKNDSEQHNYNRTNDKFYKTYNRQKYQESPYSKNKKDYRSPSRSYRDESEKYANRTPEKNFKSFSRTRRQNDSNSNSRSHSRRRKNNRYEKEDQSKNQRRRTSSVSPSDEDHHNYKSKQKKSSYNHKSSSSNSEDKFQKYHKENDDDQRQSDNQIIQQTNHEEELRKYFERMQKQKEGNYKEQTPQSSGNRTPKSADWGLSNHDSNSQESDNNQVNDDELLCINIEEQISKQFQLDLKEQQQDQDRFNSNLLQSEKSQNSKKMSLSKEDIVEQNSSNKNDSTLMGDLQKAIQIQLEQNDNKLQQEQCDAATIEQKLPKDDNKKVQFSINQSFDSKISQQAQDNSKEIFTQQKDEQNNLKPQQQQQLEEDEEEEGKIKDDKEMEIENNQNEFSKNEQGQIEAQEVVKPMQKNRSIIKEIEQFEDDDEDDDNSSIDSNKSSFPSSSGSRSSEEQDRQSVTDDRKRNRTNSNKRGSREYRKNKYKNNYNNNYNTYYHHNNYHNRNNNHYQNQGNNNYQNYKVNYMKQNNQQGNRNRSRSNSSQRYTNKRPYNDKNNNSNMNNNQFNRYNQNRNFNFNKGHYHGGYNNNQYNNQYGNQNYHNRRRSSSVISKRSYSSDKDSQSQHRNKSYNRSSSNSQPKKQVQQKSSSKNRQRQHSRSPPSQSPYQKEKVDSNSKTITETTTSGLTIIRKNKASEIQQNQQQNQSNSRSNSRKKSKSNSQFNKSYKKGKKQSHSPSSQKKESHNENKSPSSEEGEYEENNQQSYHHNQYRQRGGYQKNYKSGNNNNNNNYRRDNYNYKKNKYNQYNSNIYDRRVQSRDSSPNQNDRNKDRRSSSQSPRSRPQKYNKRDNEVYKKNQRHDKSPSSPFSPHNQHNYNGNDYNNRLKYNNNQRNNYKNYNNYNDDNRQNKYQNKYHNNYNNNNNAFNKSSKSKSRSRSSYKTNNLQKTSSGKYN